MDLFLETPRQQAERMLRQQQRLMEMQMQGAAVQPPVQNAAPAVSSADEVDPGAYSVQQDSYAQELAFDKRRARRRRWAQRLRTLAMIVLIPVGLGCIVGLIFGSKLVDVLIRKQPQATYFAILGLVVGSLLAVFPKDSLALTLELPIGLVLLAGAAFGADKFSKT